MSDEELRKALLRGESPIDVQALTERVLRRDRRRIWILAIACVVAWMLVVMLPWSTTLPMLAKVVEHRTAMDNQSACATRDAREQSTRLLQVVKQGTIATFIGSIASMFLAAICTVALIIASRRATLRQVNARLAEISSQLKLLAKDSMK
jgi:ABC-type Fe3+ transport system permease subunit